VFLQGIIMKKDHLIQRACRFWLLLKNLFKIKNENEISFTKERYLSTLECPEFFIPKMPNDNYFDYFRRGEINKGFVCYFVFGWL